MKNIYIGILLVLIFFSCKKETKKEKAIDDITSEANKFPDPPANSETYTVASIDSTLQGSVYSKCTTQTVEVVKRLEDYQTFYMENNSEIYPGNIVQGKYLKDGHLNSIGDFDRQPLTVLLKNATRSKNITIDKPDHSSLSKAVSDYDWYFYFDPPYSTYVNCVKSYSKEQSLLSLGINANWLIASAGAKFSVSNETGKSSLFIMLKQVYYTASIGYPQKPSAFFTKKVKADDLKPFFTNDNPPAFINSVSYGRIAIAKVTSSYTKDETESALNAKFKIINGSMTSKQTEILNNCSYEVVAAGGPAIDVWNIEKLNEYFTGGNVFTNISGAVPISYTANYLIDNSPFITHTVTSYTKRECN